MFVHAKKAKRFLWLYLLLAFFLMGSSLSYAASSGGYLKIGITPSTLFWYSNTSAHSEKPTDQTNQVSIWPAIRAAVGYQQSQYLAFEAGYSPWILNHSPTTNNETNRQWLHTVDASIKIMLPIADPISDSSSCTFFTKLGVAYLYLPAQQEPTKKKGLFQPSSKVKYDENRVYPAIGFGLGYNISPQIPIELSWTGLINTTPNFLPKPSHEKIEASFFQISLFQISLGYHFG